MHPNDSASRRLADLAADGIAPIEADLARIDASQLDEVLGEERAARLASLVYPNRLTLGIEMATTRLKRVQASLWPPVIANVNKAFALETEDEVAISQLESETDVMDVKEEDAIFQLLRGVLLAKKSPERP